MFNQNEITLLAECFKLAVVRELAYDLADHLDLEDGAIRDLHEKVEAYLITSEDDGQEGQLCAGAEEIKAYIKEVLEHLDGSGLMLTDDELVDEALKEFGNFGQLRKLATRYAPVSLRVAVEEQAGLEDDGRESRLYIFLYNHNRPGPVESALLRESVFTVDDMSKDNFDDFIKESRELAKQWGADLDVQVDWEDYNDFEEVV